MKPVGEGDRWKVVVLAVLTVVVFGFVLKTVLGMGAKKPATATVTQPTTPPPAPASPAAKPETVATNTTPSKGNLGFQGIEPGGPENPFRNVLPDPNRFQRGANPPPINLPNPPAGSGLKGTFPVNPMNPMNPGGKLAIGPDREAPAEPGLRLDGIVQDRAHYAMITVGQKTEMYRAGAKVAKVYEVLSIDEFGASFRGPSGVFRLEVGQAREPNQGAAPKPSSESAIADAKPLGILPLPSGG